MSNPRTVYANGKMWYSKDDAGVFTVGFTEDFLQQIRENCWAVMYGSMAVVEGTPMLAIETTDELISIPSPCTGTVVHSSTTANGAPPLLKGSNAIIRIRSAQPQGE